MTGRASLASRPETTVVRLQNANPCTSRSALRTPTGGAKTGCEMCAWGTLLRQGSSVILLTFSFIILAFRLATCFTHDAPSIFITQLFTPHPVDPAIRGNTHTQTGARPTKACVCAPTAPSPDWRLHRARSSISRAHSTLFAVSAARCAMYPEFRVPAFCVPTGPGGWLIPACPFPYVPHPSHAEEYRDRPCDASSRTSAGVVI